MMRCERPPRPRALVRYVCTGIRWGAIVILIVAATGCGNKGESAASEGRTDLPVRQVPGFYSAAESYFSPDGQRLILNARLIQGEAEFHVYTTNLDGTDKRRINSLGADACSYYFPDGQRVIFTSTRDNRSLPPGNYSDPTDYPTGAELYTCGPTGSNLKRLTHNGQYEGEVSLSPDGQWVLFTRMTGDGLDLWRMRPDGSDPFQITATEDLQEGGSFYLPDGEHIVFRAWMKEDQGPRDMPMSIYIIRDDGSELRQVTRDEGVNWAPHPSPDGIHIVFVKLLPPGNFEVYLMNLESGEQTRLTYDDGFDGFPSFSPDGHTISFSSSREMPDGSRRLNIYLMDIQDLLDARERS